MNKILKYTVEINRKLILSDFGKSKNMINIYYQQNQQINRIKHMHIIKTVSAFKMLLNENDKITDSLEKHYIVFISSFNIW